MDTSVTIGDLFQSRLCHAALGELDSRFAVEIGDRGTVTMIFGESLAFRRELAMLGESVDACGDLSPDVCRSMETFLAAHLHVRTGMDTSTLHVSTEEHVFLVGDEPGYAILVTVQFDPSTTFATFRENVLRPFISAVVDVTTPGAAGGPYVFDELAR